MVVTEYDADTAIFHLMNLCRCRNLSAAVYSSDNDFLLVSRLELTVTPTRRLTTSCAS